MTFIAWVVLGLIAGFVASKIINTNGEIVFHDIVLGIVGAVDAGYVFQTFVTSTATRVNFSSIVVAALGSVFVLFSYHAVVPRRT